LKVLFLSPDFVLPANRGLRVRALSQLRLITALEEVEHIEFLSLSSVPVPADRLRELESEVPKLHAESPIIRDTSIRRSRTAFLRFIYRRIFCNDPYLLAINYVAEMQTLLERCLSSVRYDVVYVGYLGMAGYAKLIRKLAPQATLILEQHNLEWQIFGRLAGQLTTPLRQLAQIEASVLRRFEQNALRQFDSVIAISKADAEQFRVLAGVDSIVVSPYVEPAKPRIEESSEPHVGYVGLLAWQPNVLGLSWFCREVWPLVRKAVPNARLTIAGSGLRKLSSGAFDVPADWHQPGISTVGFIDDLNELYRVTLAMIAPVIGGSGVRMKLLETLSAGMPNVTTPDGAAGLEVTHDRELLIANGANDFANCVVRVLTDPELRERLRNNGYAYLKSAHSEQLSRTQLRQAMTGSSGKAMA
jgi:glycosyltransferase involved in cell wall biosynthesis